MSFNIYTPINFNKDYSTIVKDQWRNWNATKSDIDAASFVIFKEFSELHLKFLSGGACKLYLFLGLNSRNTGESWYSVKKMADALDVTPRTVDGWLQELEDRGLILKDKLGKTSICYLIPYSINMINMKMPVDYDTGSETLSNMIQRANNEKKIVGSLHRIYHIFQWDNIEESRSIQMLAVITKKNHSKGNPLYTAYFSYGYVSNPMYSIDVNDIIAPVRFESWFNTDNAEVTGIALESMYSLAKCKYQEDALSQLSQIPVKNLHDFKQADVIKSPSAVTDKDEVFNNYKISPVDNDIVKTNVNE